MPRQLIADQRFFLTAFSVYLLLGGLSFMGYRQGVEVVYSSTHHSPWANVFFVLCSQLAEGWGMLWVGVGLLLWQLRYAVIYVIDIAMLGAVSQGLKHFVFADHMRPAVVIGSHQSLDYIQGVDILQAYSFPSGHTATAFGVCFLLAIFFKKSGVSAGLLVIAMLVGTSRIYLLQHFWVDVYFGSITGVMVTAIVYVLTRGILHSEQPYWAYSIAGKCVEVLSKKS
jgi:membrane-associated phospholipid phosphatase